MPKGIKRARSPYDRTGRSLNSRIHLLNPPIQTHPLRGFCARDHPASIRPLNTTHVRICEILHQQADRGGLNRLPRVGEDHHFPCVTVIASFRAEALPCGQLIHEHVDRGVARIFTENCFGSICRAVRNHHDAAALGGIIQSEQVPQLPFQDTLLIAHHHYDRDHWLLW